MDTVEKNKRLCLSAFLMGMSMLLAGSASLSVAAHNERTDSTLLLMTVILYLIAGWLFGFASGRYPRP